MIRLLTLCLVTAAIKIKVAGSFQTGPSGGESSPLYNLLASSLLSKYPQLNSTTDTPPLTCTCGFCNQQTPIGPPLELQQPPTILSGVVMFPTSELQQVLRAPVPVPLYAPSPHPPSSPRPPPSGTPPSYIMNIPKKYATQIPPSNTIQETYYPPSRNAKYSFPSPPPNSTPPRFYQFSPKSPPLASCPATVYFPATQSLSFNQPYMYSAAPSPKVNPSFSSNPPGPIFPPQSQPKFQMTVPATPAPPSPPIAAKEPLVTYNLRTSTSPDVFPGTSLEAESRDCSVPTPPVLV